MARSRAAASGSGEARRRVLTEGRALLPALASAPITALLTVIACVSYSAIVFSGPLASHYAMGVGLALVSAIVLTLVVCMGSSYAGSLAYAQAEPAVVIGVIVQGLAASLGAAAAPEQVLPTVLVAISVASLACGLCFVLLGWLRGGDLVRYVPLPVVGGFLAGVGGLLIKASLVAPLGPAAAAGLPWSLLQGDAALHWLPGVIAGLILWLLQARHSSFLNMPLVLGVLIAGFWLAALVSGATRGELAAAGWLYADLPADRLWSAGQHVVGLDLVAWRLLPGHALEFLTLLVVTTIAMLLTANSIELSVGRDIDLNRELRWLGLGNLLVGGLGALPGYHSTSGSILTHRLGTPWRAVGALTAALCLAMLLIGPGLLPLMPKLVTGTILFYVGLGLTVDWLCRTFSRMHPADWLVLFLVFGFVAFVGLIEGLAIGVAAGLVIFVLRYSRIDAVRNIASGATLRSNLERSEAARDALGRQGEAIFILTLQGYVFFGTSHRLLSLIRRRMLDPEAAPLGFLVLDFHLVSGVDASAAASFTKLARYAGEQGFFVLLAGVPAPVAVVFRREGLLAAGSTVEVLPDLDRALEWSENRLLERPAPAWPDAAVPIAEMLAAVFADPADRALFQRHLTPYAFEAGDVLIVQGAASDDLLFLEAGRVEVRLELAGRSPLRLRAMDPGTVVGEIAFYLGVPRSASVIAVAPGRAHRLTRTALAQIERERPRLATAFHQRMARLLAGKLNDSNAALGALVR
jgi:sulfate permease, SulP family